MNFSTEAHLSSEVNYSEKHRYSRIRDLVVEWYEKNCLQDENESFAFDLSKKEDRLKVIMLGVFYNCIFQETKALRLFKEMEKAGYLNYQELTNFENNLKHVMRNLERQTVKSWRILKIQNIIDSAKALEELFSEKDDVTDIIEREGVESFIKYLYKELRGTKAKLMWICRECKNHFQIPEAYCYVPDSHVNKFLYNIGFLENLKVFSLEECLQISKNMSLLLGNKYFDLPYMRYHQKKCRSCEKGRKVECQIECESTNQKTKQSS
jgi:hypothetical protein